MKTHAFAPSPSLSDSDSSVSLDEPIVPQSPFGPHQLHRPHIPASASSASTATSSPTTARPASVSTLTSYNAFLMPLVAPFFLSRVFLLTDWFKTWVGHHDDDSHSDSIGSSVPTGTAQPPPSSSLSSVTTSSGLRVAAFQEMWAWRAGWFYPILWIVQKLELLVGWLCCCHGVTFLWRVCGAKAAVGDGFDAADPSIATALCSVCAGACTPFDACIWDPKHAAMSVLADTPMRHGVGLGGMSLPLHCHQGQLKILDSGLLLVANRAPVMRDFRPFKSGNALELTSNKGMLWAYFEETARAGSGGALEGTLVMTTHLAGPGDEEMGYQQQQMVEVEEYLTELCDQFRPRLPPGRFHVYLTGDFNVTPSDPAFQRLVRTTGLQILSHTDLPTSECGNTIDHILGSPVGLAAGKKPTPVPHPASDHHLVGLFGLHTAGAPKLGDASAAANAHSPEQLVMDL